MGHAGRHPGAGRLRRQRHGRHRGLPAQHGDVVRQEPVRRSLGAARRFARSARSVGRRARGARRLPPSTGTWHIRNRATNTSEQIVWGVPGDRPVGVRMPVLFRSPTDFDGDGRADLTIFRPSSRTWFTDQSSTGSLTGTVWGSYPFDSLVPGDYDGDGRSDRAVFHPADGTWSIARTTSGSLALVWGINEDRPAPEDYDGDGLTDVAVFRPSTAVWYRLYSSTGTGEATTWGGGGDLPVAADFDGDGRADLAVDRRVAGAGTPGRFATRAAASCRA